MREKVHPNRSSVSEVYTCSNNQNMISIVAVRPNIDDNIFSRKQNSAQLGDVNENGWLADPNYFESELSFLYEDMKILPKPSE
jgi:hypothetical protein